MTRTAAAMGLLALAGAMTVAATAGQANAPPTVGCDGIILRVRSGTESGYRVVLGVVSVPPAYRPQVAPNPGPWPFWSKSGLAVRAGTHDVVVTVPKAWRRRAAITWGHIGIVSALRIAPCSADPPKVWNGYAGGFLLRSRSACVPLTFRVGRRSRTVRFGIGRHCT
jgi:hypothetical protein